tara:strand:- start:85 stop:306 length:222 start_codon:yes stop_codon:yes gene_type:complete
MTKLKKRRVHKAICPTCNGNGYIRIKDVEDPIEDTVHQCWDCDSEGEFYVYEPQMASSNDANNGNRNINKLLH